MNFLSPYDPPEDQEGLLLAIRRTGQRALSTVPGARWILGVVDHLYRQLDGAIAAYKYRRDNRRAFLKLMNGWGASDAYSQAAHRFCMRVYSLMANDEQREQFTMAVVAFAQMNTQQAVEYFSQREQEYVSTYFSSLLIEFRRR